MKAAKQEALYEALNSLIQASIQLGAAQQRHQDAAGDEAEAGQLVAEIGTEIGTLISGPPPKPTVN